MAASAESLQQEFVAKEVELRTDIQRLTTQLADAVAQLAATEVRSSRLPDDTDV